MTGEDSNNMNAPAVSSVTTGNGHINPVLVQLIKLALEKWKLLLIVGFLAGIGGIIYAYLQKPKFESRLTFALDAGSGDGALSAAMNLAARFGLGSSAGQSMFDGDNILEIMKSRRIVEDVLLSVDTFVENKPTTFINYYLEIAGIRKLLDAKPYLKDINFPAGIQKPELTYRQDSILNNIYLDFITTNISAERPDKKLSIYEVRVKSLNEKFTKAFTDRLIERTTNFYVDITSKKEKETLEILEKRVASLKDNVSGSIDIKSASQDANLNPAFAAAQAPVLKEQYNVMAYGEAYKEMFKTLEMARYQYLKKIPLLQIIDNAGYPMKKIKQGKLKTGIMFSIIAVFVSIFIIWVMSLFKKEPY